MKDILLSLKGTTVVRRTMLIMSYMRSFVVSANYICYNKDRSYSISFH